MIRILALDIAVLAFTVYFLIVFATQIFLPILRGTKLFPFFRQEKKLEQQIREVDQQIVEEGIAEELDERQEILEAKRTKRTARAKKKDTTTK